MKTVAAVAVRLAGSISTGDRPSVLDVESFMKRPACLVALVVLLASVSAASGDEPASVPPNKDVPATAPAKLTVEALKNAEYRSELVGDGRARLVNGVHVEKESPNSATETRMSLSDTMATGDLNGDGAPDAAVVLVINTGGTGHFYELAAVLNQKGEPKHAASISLGDRVRIKEIMIRDGQITVRMVTQGPNDPMSTPTLEVTQKYFLKDGKLAQVK